MRDLSFYLLFISVILPIIQAYKKPGEIYQLPFLYSMAMMVYILPTLFGVMDNRSILSDSEYTRYVLFSFACFWIAIIGYRLFKINEKSKPPKKYIYNEKKMSIFLYIVMIISFTMIIIMGGFDPDSRNGGIYAVILYPARFLRPATIMLFILYLLKPSKDKLIFLIISFLFSLKIILIDGRRSEVFNLFITIIFPLFFIKNKIIPRILILPAILIGLFIFTFLPAAREYTLKGDFSKVFSLSPKELIVSQINAENTNEVVEAARNMEVTALSGHFNWGVSLYNGLVLQFASSTFFGENFKKSLLLSSNLNLDDLREKHAKTSDDEYRFYLAPTGFSAAFFEFGYGGVLLFLVFGIIAKAVYLRAVERTNISSIMFYCFFATFILFSIYDSLISIPIMLISYLLIFLIAKGYSRIREI